MAWIGSDGSEGKEGSDSAATMLLAQSVGGLLQNLSPTRNLPVVREFFSAELGQPTGQIDADTQEASDEYWQQAHNMGIVDSVTARTDGSTTFVLTVASEEEARSIIDQDPVVRTGHFGSVAINRIRSV